MTRIEREAIETAIEALIAVLDVIDGDPDIEESGDLEPSLAHTVHGGCCDSDEPDLEENEAWAA